ncbi:hypothetical protein [Streptomyces sp. NBC_01483]|uniref:hypothetical protein n=1 Tax=Streptomyces sp. NBC_01483 TaxID=2903883 RepID=UPI002E32E064|nr:hypothetical protein [Streptomyces sp. NBC_01483]
MPAGTSRAIAHTISQFAGSVIPQEGKDITRTLEAMRTKHLERARAVFPVAGAHLGPVRSIKPGSVFGNAHRQGAAELPLSDQTPIGLR